MTPYEAVRNLVNSWRRLQQLPPWVRPALLGAMLAACWTVVYTAGGSRTAFPHIFYVPIVLAGLPFGLWGGVVAALVATVLCGPLMPFDVSSGQSQAVINWLVRGGFFVMVGAISGAVTVGLRRTFHSDLVEQIWSELEYPVRGTNVGDAETVPRVGRVLEERLFHPVFQPIYSLRGGHLLAVEALTRFDAEPEQGPDVWFREAEDTGLALDLELAAVDEALQASAELDHGVALTFNASPALLFDPRLLMLLDAYAERLLIAEVTEHAAVEDYSKLDAVIATLREREVRLAVDDAGAGFASLRHIVRLAPDFIKLDPSLTQNLGQDPIRRPLAECLLQFAQRTGTSVIVEGIETPVDLATWQALGADAAQGYLLGRPGPLPAPQWSAAITGQQAGFGFLQGRAPLDTLLR